MRETHAIPQVHQAMTSMPVTVTADSRVADLWPLFDRHDYNLVPVVDGQGVFCGIVSVGDLLRTRRGELDDERIQRRRRVVAARA